MDHRRPRCFRSCIGPSKYLSKMNNPYSFITARKVRQICGDYTILKHIESHTPTLNERPDYPQEDWIAFYELPFTFGFRFLIHELANEILHHFNLAPAKLMPNAYHTILSNMLLGETGGRQLNLKEFLVYYMLKFNSKNRARQYFSYWTNRQLVKELKNTGVHYH